MMLAEKVSVVESKAPNGAFFDPDTQVPPATETPKPTRSKAPNGAFFDPDFRMIQDGAMLNIGVEGP